VHHKYIIFLPLYSKICINFFSIFYFNIQNETKLDQGEQTNEKKSEVQEVLVDDFEEISDSEE